MFRYLTWKRAAIGVAVVSAIIGHTWLNLKRKESFLDYDEDNSGSFDKEEFMAYVRSRDDDGNGLISIEEFYEIFDDIMHSSLREFDKNGDGEYSEQELAAFMNNFLESYRHLDTNNDNIIDLEEMKDFYALIDDDHNGAITLEELDLFMKKRLQDLFNEYDDDGSGFIDMTEFYKILKDIDTSADGNVDVEEIMILLFKKEREKEEQ